jgi:hypothetical protein
MAGDKDKKSKVPDRASRSGSISSSKKFTRKGPDKDPKVEIDPELLLSARKKKDSGEEDAR